MTTPSELARALQALRKTRAGGRPPKFRKCKRCGQKFSARELRQHLPGCAQKIASKR